jgi:hypothetical protein
LAGRGIRRYPQVFANGARSPPENASFRVLFRHAAHDADWCCAGTVPVFPLPSCDADRPQAHPSRQATGSPEQDDPREGLSRRQPLAQDPPRPARHAPRRRFARVAPLGSRFEETLGEQPLRTLLKAVFETLVRNLAEAEPTLGAGDSTALSARPPRVFRASVLLSCGCDVRAPPFGDPLHLERAGEPRRNRTRVLAGFRYAIEHQFDWLTNLDADFSHHPRHLPALLECMDRCDVAIGSRYVKGGGVVGWGFRRHFMSQGINWHVQLLLGLRTRDNSGSYRCKKPFQNPVAGTRTSTGSSLAGTRFRKRRCTAAARSAADSRKPRSCSRTAATASQRSASRNRGRRSA